ncbi:MAG TPA: secretin N-terminal domain-containing protein [Thermoanaerobaculia bacterium]|nr:secretin N-terminal domain-containing protein [Thermoanaerobaculia bacterium]
MKRITGCTLVAVLLVATLAGCTAHRVFRQAEIAGELGNWDEAVLKYMEALQEDPSNLRYKAALLRARLNASRQHFERGKQYREAGVLERSLVELQQAVQLDPTNQYAEAELESVRQQILALREGRNADTLAEMKRRTSGALPQPPVLDPRSDEPIDLDFPEPTSIFQIYKALGDAFGINVLYDQNLKDQDISITLKEVSAETSLETLMRAAGHFYKVLDEHTIIIAADTQQNRKTYEDLVIQTFFLSNLEVKEMMTILRSLIDSRRISSNEQLNAIILRDTADKVKVAERIIQANDKARAEVVVDVELLQIDSANFRELGTALSQYSVTQSLDLGSDDAVLRISDLEFLDQSNWALTIPNFIYNFVKRSTDAQLLAQPQLRSSEGERARAVIGDRVPIPVTSFNTSNTVGSNIVPVTSFQYQDVGITIEIEPRVHHNQEITLQMRVEVSNISGFIQGSGGQQQPRIGTRIIESTIRLRDGETNLVAGLIRTDETSALQGLPGLSDIPIIGQLFSNRSNDRSRTDLILTLTPHIVRQAEITEADLLPIWVGTESNITFRGDSPRLESDAAGPFDGASTPEEVQEMMRRRLEQLPPGLRDGQGEQEEPEPPSGIDLVPTQRPGSIFDAPEPPPEPEDDSAFDGNPILDDGGSTAALTFPGSDSPFALASWRPAAGDGTAATSAVVASEAVTARVRLTPSRPVVAVGDTFEVALEAAVERPVSHLPLTVEYDPEVLAVESVTGGDFLGGESEAQVLSDAGRRGRVVIGASRLGQAPGVLGEGRVATIVFRAVAAGESRLTFADGRALDALLQPLAPFRADAATVTVDAAASKPERPEELRRELRRESTQGPKS